MSPRKPVRCSLCGQSVYPPCYPCWLRRWLARGCTWDPLDMRPGYDDRPEDVPSELRTSEIPQIALRLRAGRSVKETARRFSRSVHAVERLAEVLTRIGFLEPETQTQEV